jgi:hypothetical protein
MCHLEHVVDEGANKSLIDNQQLYKEAQKQSFRQAATSLNSDGYRLAYFVDDLDLASADLLSPIAEETALFGRLSDLVS